MQRQAISLLYTLVIALSAWGDGFASNIPLRFTNITNEDGLIHNGVYRILEDSEGFLWFGTRNGLSRYDGTRFLNFNHNPFDTTSLPGDHIIDMAEDQEGQIWIGTKHGELARFDPLREIFTPVLLDPEKDPASVGNEITALLCDSRGNIWIGSEQGLTVFLTESRERITFTHDPDDPASISDDHITALHEYPSGTLWVGTKSIALISIDLDDLSFHPIQQALLPPRDGGYYISAIISDTTRECLWVTVWGEGLLRYELESGAIKNYGTYTRHPKLVNKIALYDMGMDAAGTLWLASVAGLTRFDPDKEVFSFFEQDDRSNHGFQGKIVNSLLFDRQGILWAATNSSGVNRCKLDQVRFQHIKHEDDDPNSLSSNDVYGIMVDRDGDIWVSTVGGGTNRLNLQSRTNQLYVTDDSFHSWSMNYANKTIQDRNGNFWIATFHAGLNRIEANSGERTLYHHEPGDSLSLSHNDIYSLLETDDGHIWVGTNGGGLNEYLPDEQHFHRYQHNPDDPTSIPGEIIFTLLEDRQGTLWIGTADAGLCLMDRETGTFSSYRSESNAAQVLASNHILTLFEDRESNLWIGARNSGLTRLNPQRDQFEYIDLGWPQTGLEVSGILEDEAGYLWLSTNHGILKVHPKEGLVNIYDISDGVQGLDFKFSTCAKDAEGFMYFGGASGFNRFHPDSIRNNAHIPPVRLTKLWVNNEVAHIGDAIDGQVILSQSITHTDGLKLNYRHKVLRFEFAALDFVDPSLNRYAYQMSPFDDDWVYSGTRNAVTYTSLDPGRYTFRVKATNNDGIWNETGTSLQILITPPFWRTFWFRSLVALFLIGLGMSIYQIRINKLRRFERRRLKEQKVQMQLEHQQRELVTKSMDLIEKQKFMEDILDQLKTLAKSSESERQVQTRALIKKLTSLVSFNHVWDEFERWFTKIHTGFITNLRKDHPTLSTSEVKVCVLLRLNLMSKEIASLLNIEPASVDTHRYRIRKKIGLDQDENLAKYLSKY